MGRPTKRTDETTKAITDALRIGCTRLASAQAAGISYETLRDWMTRYPAFSAAVLVAEGEAKRSAQLAIMTAIRQGSWRAALEWYGRRYPREMGTLTQVEMRVDVRQEAVRIMRRLAQDEGREATLEEEAEAVRQAELLIAEAREERRFEA